MITMIILNEDFLLIIAQNCKYYFLLEFCVILKICLISVNLFKIYIFCLVSKTGINDQGHQTLNDKASLKDIRIRYHFLF